MPIVSAVSAPTPGRPKITSTYSTKPPNACEKSRPQMFTGGISPLRRTWRRITCFSDSPFARAVRTQSSSTVSRSEARTTCTYAPAKGTAEAIHGRNRCFAQLPRVVPQRDVALLGEDPPAVGDERPEQRRQDERRHRVGGRGGGGDHPVLPAPPVPDADQRQPDAEPDGDQPGPGDERDGDRQRLQEHGAQARRSCSSTRPRQSGCSPSGARTGRAADRRGRTSRSRARGSHRCPSPRRPSQIGGVHVRDRPEEDEGDDRRDPGGDERRQRSRRAANPITARAPGRG